MASLYPDSKTFVDMKMRQSPEKTLAKFREFIATSGAAPSKTQVQAWVEKHFEPVNLDLNEYDPPDWTACPEFLTKIKDKCLRRFGRKLNALWKSLARTVKDDVRVHPELYSSIHVPKAVIVPAGRYRELYYWDSYWIIKGILHSEMWDTARGMLDNMVYLIKRYGLVPNGTRIYYTKRSQPPMLISMVQEYLNHTNDFGWVRENIHALEKEFDFWLNKRSVRVRKSSTWYTLCRYYSEPCGPRPEAYREDYSRSQVFKSKEERENYWAEVRAAAESGWDFSSRWWILDATKDRQERGDLNLAYASIKTRSIVPVELNAIIYKNARLLAEYNKRLGNVLSAAKYKRKALEWRKAVTEILWHEDLGIWLDYDGLNCKRRESFHPSNVVPLWTGCYDDSRIADIACKVVCYLRCNQVTSFPGGVPASLARHSDEQWDYPNCWPPLQYFIVMALEKTNNPDALNLAFEVVQKWVRVSYRAHKRSGVLYEFNDAREAGNIGRAKDTEVQLGFGWSIGVVIDFLYRYGDRLEVGIDDVTIPKELGCGCKDTSARGKAKRDQKAKLLVSGVNFNLLGHL